MSLLVAGPSRLLASLVAVKTAHPYSDRGPLEMSPRLRADAATLWERLGAMAPRRRDAAVSRLSGIELRLLAATANSMVNQEWTHAALVRACRHTADEALSGILWEAFLLSSGTTPLRALAAEIAARTDAPALWKWLVGDASPSVLAASAFMGQTRMQFREWMIRADVALAPYTTFVHLTQLRLITPPMLERVDRAVSPAQIDAWSLAAVSSPEMPAWHRTYIETTAGHPRESDHAVLVRIVDEHGSPTDGYDFWRDLSPRATTDVDQWLRVKQLAALMQRADLVEFWRRMLPEIRSAMPNRDGRVVYVLFEHAVAVQFLDDAPEVVVFPADMLAVLRRDDAHRIRQRVLELAAHAVGRVTLGGDAGEAEMRAALAMASP